MVHTWAKDYVKYDGHNVERVHIFLSGSEGTVESHLKKVTWLYHCKDPGKARVVLVGPTVISLVNIYGNFSNSRLIIKPGTKFPGLSDKYKAALRNELSQMEFFNYRWIK